MTLPFAAYQGPEPFVFVSYAHEDADSVFSELLWMREQGFNVWYDEGIGPGHSWPEELARAIENCTLFLLLVTPRSAVSRNCHREINYALGKGKEFLAIHLEDTQLPSGLALEIGDRQAIIRTQFSKEDYHQKLLQALAGFIAPPTTEIRDQRRPPKRKRARSSKSMFALALGVIVAGLVAAGLWWQAQHAKNEAERLFQAWQTAVDEEDNLLAFRLARDLKLSDEQLATFSQEGELLTNPAGADVSIAPYLKDEAEDDDWLLLGKTPLTMNWPLGGFRIRVQSAGFGDQEILLVNPSSTLGNSFFMRFLRENDRAIPLVPQGKYPTDMVYVPGGQFVPMVMGFGIGAGAMIAHGAFLIDRYEITNRQYQEFVDAGAYTNEALWPDMEFTDQAGVISFAQAMARFTDTTGRAGPATWESGAYPLGEDDFPVCGISWYEAVAYARFVNKRLPAVAYWARAAYTPHGGGIGTNQHSGYVVPASNFDSPGPRKVTELKGLSPSGTFGQAGNVREWLSNSAGAARWIVGGAVNDETYMSTNYNTTYPMDRDPLNGVRLMRYLDEPDAALLADKPLLGKSGEDYVPVSDEVFKTFREQFQYDPSNLDPVTEMVDYAGSELTWQKVSLRTDYDESRFNVHIIKPLANPKPETVLFFSGAGAVAQQPNSFSLDRALAAIDFILKSGRVVVVPELYESYSRSTKYMSSSTGIEFREWLLNWHSDLGRTLDYLQSRPEEFGQSYTWYGVSYGASVQLPLLALENRFSSAILVIGGVTQSKSSLSLIDNLNYVPRITIPVLFIGARHDSVFPVKYSQQPFLDLLGTPVDQVRRIDFDGSHTIPPRRLMVREIINWLDERG